MERIRVLIVAKTRRGSGACVGGITAEGRSVRLEAANAGTDEHAGLEYAVGEVWEVEAVPPKHLTPPHVENLVVFARKRVTSLADPVDAIERRMPPKMGGIDAIVRRAAAGHRHGCALHRRAHRRAAL